MRKIKYIKKILIPFLILNLLFLILFLVNIFPNKNVQKNIKKSSVYYKKNITRYSLIPNHTELTDDTIADSIMLNMMYHTKSQNSIKTTLLSPYYDSESLFYTEALNKTIKKNIAPNETYSRYWHGFKIFYIPLLLFFTTKYIKIILGIATILLLLYFYYLNRKDNKDFSILFIIAFVLSGMYSAFISLEYIPITIVLLITLVYMTKIKDENIDYGVFFSILGILTAFFDFLTIETVMFGTPFLFYAYLNRNNIKIKQFIHLGISWTLGYISTFSYKWLLTKLFYPDNNENIKENIVKHIDGKYAKWGIKANIKMLFPFINNYNQAFKVFILIIFISIIIWYFIHSKVNLQYQIILFITASIPYIRYTLLKEHSFFHSFFTYRAQFITILCLLLILNENIFKQGGNYFDKHNKKTT